MKITLIIISFMISLGVIQAQSHDATAMQKFCEDFALCIEKGNPNKCVKFFDKTYRKEQLKFLNGNKKQFVEEFLAGFNHDGSMITPSIEDIHSFKLEKIHCSSASYCDAIYTLSLKSGLSYSVSATVVILRAKKFGFRGAMG
jgi:hypothetical protein